MLNFRKARLTILFADRKRHMRRICEGVRNLKQNLSKNMHGFRMCAARLLPLKSTVLCAFFPVSPQDPDIPKASKTRDSFFEHAAKKETPKERLYFMYSMDEFGNISPELQSAYQATFFGGFLGACIGGLLHSRAAYLQFIEQNQATVFKNHLDAKKQLQDRVTVNMAKGAFRWGWRLALFSGSYILIQTTISVYRGKSSIWEYLISGGIVGTCFRMSLGLRGMLVGGLLGTVLGTVSGMASLAILKMSGMTMEEMRYWQYQWKDWRQEQEIGGAKKGRMEDDILLLKEREAEHGSEMKLLDSIPDREVAK